MTVSIQSNLSGECCRRFFELNEPLLTQVKIERTLNEPVLIDCQGSRYGLK